jgi:hypothetical protein
MRLLFRVSDSFLKLWGLRVSANGF